MRNLPIKISIFLNYFVFAILLNSVGIVIAKSIKVYGVDEKQASILEAFKDLPIAIVSIIVASSLPRLGYKKAMQSALLIVFFGCIGMHYGNSFWTAKLLFLSVGISFALIKLSVYSLVGVVTDTPQQHSSLMSAIEGFFMVGIAVAYFLFPAFYSDTDTNAWLNVYLLLAALIAVSFLFLSFSNINIPAETAGSSALDDIKESLKLIIIPLVLIFISSAFFFVMIEQGIMTWLPRFNEKIFSFSDKLSVQMASILAISLAAGRFLAGWLSKKISWSLIVISCAILSLILILVILPQLKPANEVMVLNKLSDVPMLGFILPLIGLFIAPIYPLLNSTVLSHLPKHLHSPMSGLIIVFSALGGTIGSRIVGTLFKNIGGVNAFYFLIIPIVLLIISVILIQRIIKKDELKKAN
ncbi:MAG: MFS transporter [Chitinophaga sp.]|jgi:MFS transporter, FHS family, glucose/mannose:H+ symporter|nr:MFS transporter [Chitinophaga sp.]